MVRLLPDRDDNSEHLQAEKQIEGIERKIIMAEITISKNYFMQEVVSWDKPVLVDCWASWFGPCKMLIPVLHEIAEEYAGAVKVARSM